MPKKTNSDKSHPVKSYPGKLNFDAVIFDLDGVVTQTAAVHFQAWKQLFDEYLSQRAAKSGVSFDDFTEDRDYLPYVDGKPRHAGIESFLASRGIDLPLGSPGDSAGTRTIHGLGNRKNRIFHDLITHQGVGIYASTIAFIGELKKRGVRIGMASSSRNCEMILKRSNLGGLFEVRVDGTVSARLGLKGKPAPDIFTTACEQLGVLPGRSVVVEDAASGVKAGESGDFGFVLGVARQNNGQELLAHGADRAVRDVSEITIDEIDQWFAEGIREDGWKLHYYGFSPETEKLRESLLTLGNGYLATRGAMEETGRRPAGCPGTYMAGVYNALSSRIQGETITNEDMVNCPNWLPISVVIDNDGNDGVVGARDSDFNRLHRELSFRTGVLSKRLLMGDPFGDRLEIVSQRFVGMHNPHMAGIRYTITCLRPETRLTLRAGLDGGVKNQGVRRYAGLADGHLMTDGVGADDNIMYLRSKTSASGITISQAAKLQLSINGNPVPVKFDSEIQEDAVCLSTRQTLNAGESLTLDKVVSIHKTERSETKDGLSEAMRDVESSKGFDSEREMSAWSWKRIWDRCDVRITGSRLAQKAIRLNIFHLMCTASPHNREIDAGIPARGLHGEAYRGHIFWDELFILPFYCLSFPEIAKSALLYRYRRLPAARKIASDTGGAGAVYPWQSGSTGEEVTQAVHLNPLTGQWRKDGSYLQRHVSLAVAFNVGLYVDYTGDMAFLEKYGMEMVIEICRYWAQAAVYNPSSGRYDISDVMGPDEFHERYPGAETGGLKNNSYTNIMTAWMFDKVIRLLDHFPQQHRAKICGRHKLSDHEVSEWKTIGSKLALPISAEGIIGQFDGYFDLEELDLGAYAEKYTDMGRMDRILNSEGRSADQYKIGKQADALMPFYCIGEQETRRIIEQLGYVVPDDFFRMNFEYYYGRTSHGSTLSKLVHARLAHMMGKKKLGFKLYLEALTSDLRDVQGGTTGEGIHTGVMAGSVLAAMWSYAGLDVKNGEPIVDPDLPDRWEQLEFDVLFRGRSYNICARQGTFSMEGRRIKNTEKLSPEPFPE
ncbi:MAG: beta-phosphoglucomutase family hydrolase [Desulfobacteraceae bacterium]|nr:beta-phosphoglucomutase family hydrolase [Desulfobacteraceae bacterium]